MNNVKKTQSTTDSVHRVQRYRPNPNPDHPYAGNPLIEAFAPMTPSRILDALSNLPECTAEMRTHSPIDRMQYARAILNFFFPLPWQIRFAEQLWTTICESYRRRNPMARPEGDRWADRMERLAANDAPDPNDAMQALLNSSIALVGTPGCGKTEVPRRFLEAMGGKDLALLHAQGRRPYQVLFVWVDAPTTKSDKALAKAVYEQLYRAVRLTESDHPRISHTSTATDYKKECASLIDMLNVGVIVIDEIQHWLSKKGVDEHAVAFLSSLVAIAGCVLVFIGTWEAAPLFTQSLKLGRRGTTIGTTFVRAIPKGKQFNEFVTQLFHYQCTTGVVDCNQDYIDVFHHHTYGIPDLCQKLMLFAQSAAIAKGLDTISIDLINQCAEEHLKFICSAIEQMRNGTPETSRTIWDAQPDDVDEYIQARIAELELQASALSLPSQKTEEITIEVKVEQVAKHLVLLERASEEQARAISAELARQFPRLGLPELLVEGIKRCTPKAPQPTRDVRKQKKRDVDFEQLDERDIRRVVYQANRAHTDVEEALRKAEHVFEPGELEAA